MAVIGILFLAAIFLALTYQTLQRPTGVQCGEGLQHAEFPVPFPRRGSPVRFLDL